MKKKYSLLNLTEEESRLICNKRFRKKWEEYCEQVRLSTKSNKTVYKTDKTE